MFVRSKAVHMLFGITLGFVALICECATNEQTYKSGSRPMRSKMSESFEK